jgi:hypothetical protein
MTSTVRLSSWTIDEGTYPTMRKGEVIKVALEVEPLGPFEPTTLATAFSTNDSAQCSFRASVLRTFIEEGERPIAAFDADGVRFYVEREEMATLRPGEVVSGRGIVSIDDYLWAEFYAETAAPLDLFNTVQIAAIRVLREGTSPRGQDEIDETPSASRSGQTVVLDLASVQGPTRGMAPTFRG